MPVSALASAVGQPVPIVIARVDGPLFFADARPVPPSAWTSSSRREAPTRIVVDAEAVHLTDTDGADMLIQFEEELRSPGLALALARVHPPVLALWKCAGVIDTIGEATFSTPCTTLSRR